MTSSEPYFRRDLALVHHLGFGFHAERCAPGILDLLAGVRERNGLVVEIGCGSGLLTRRLVEAGHRVAATDASPAMLDLARRNVPGAVSIDELRLPDDPIPAADAVVAVGHPISYVSSGEELERSLVTMARAVRPGGILAIDVCDLSWGEARREQPNLGDVHDDWAIVTRFSLPSPERFVRDIVTFVRRQDGTWSRDDEHHENVLVDTSRLPAVLAVEGMDARVGRSFGGETHPEGLHVLIATRPDAT
jgi:SAM-dependent methyltransferase